VHRAMHGIPLVLDELVVTPDSDIQNVDSVHDVPFLGREVMPLAGPRELAAGLEIEKGFDEEAAKKEAARCLQCGLICYVHEGNRKRLQLVG